MSSQLGQPAPPLLLLTFWKFPLICLCRGGGGRPTGTVRNHWSTAPLWSRSVVLVGLPCDFDAFQGAILRNKILDFWSMVRAFLTHCCSLIPHPALLCVFELFNRGMMSTIHQSHASTRVSMMMTRGGGGCVTIRIFGLYLGCRMVW